MKPRKKVMKIIAIIIALSFVLMFSGCSSDKSEKDVIIEYDIISARYLLITHEDTHDETLTISYMYNGEYRTEDIIPSIELTIGDRDKVLEYNPGTFFKYRKDHVLTPETYNKIIEASPNVYELR